MNGMYRTVQCQILARAMFVRTAEQYESDPEAIERAWRDEEIRAFWLGEAAFVIYTIAAMPRGIE